MKRYLHFIVWFGLVSIGTPSMLAANAVNEERTADSLFHHQQYSEAIAIWKSMANHKSNAGLYFNIGLAESKLKHPAEAVYAYEQALRLCPLNQYYSNALETERKKLDNPVIPLNSFFLERWYLGWITFFRPGLWAILGLLILAGMLTAYLMSINALPGKKRIPPAAIKWVGLAGILFLFTAFLSILHLENRDEGIIMNTCELKQASSGDSPTLRLLSGGEKVKIKDQIGEWYYVALLNLDYGWIKTDCFKRITILDSR